MANFQLSEANFQFMTIFPLIQKQRQTKILGERTVWDYPQPKDSLGLPGQQSHPYPPV